jgi:C1A family cysteine protease
MKTLNAVKSPPDARDYQFVATFAPQAKTDLRSYNRDIEDQAQQGSCTANALTNAIEIGTERIGQYENLSRQFQYYETRHLSGLDGKEGVYALRDSLEASRLYGICLETDWPYSTAHENLVPPATAYANAALRTVSRYEAVDIADAIKLGVLDLVKGVNNIKAALAEGLPVAYACAVGQKIFGLTGPLASHRYGLIDLPGQPSTGNGYAGGHAMVIVGNDDTLNGGSFIVENSWGAAYGDQGYAAIPYMCVRDFIEAWVIRGFKGVSYTDPVLYAAQMRLVKLYVAILGRAPELSGFQWWLNEITKGADITDVAMGFLESAESRARFANNGQVVCDIVYNQVQFANRVEVAAYFVLDLVCNKLEIAKVALDNVTADPVTVVAAKKRIRQLITGGVL